MHEIKSHIMRVDGMDSEGVAMTLTVTTHPTVDGSGSPPVMNIYRIETAEGEFLSPDPVDGWYVAESGRKFRAADGLDYTHPLDDPKAP